jgi:hypothetical protein
LENVKGEKLEKARAQKINLSQNIVGKENNIYLHNIKYQQCLEEK